MSRSRRKPYITDQQHSSDSKWRKRQANRAVRSAPLEEAPNGKQYRKYYNSWDIRDWSIHDPKNPKAYKK